MISCTCICIWERKVGSIRDVEADAGKSASHACICTLNYPYTGSQALRSRHGGLSSLTSTLNDHRLIQIANYLHKSTLCREGISSCFHFHPNLRLTWTTGLAPWIYICIADEKMQMHMRIQDHWACPNTLPSLASAGH